MLGGLLPEGMMFPFDFGFIPSTLGADEDPLDIMVLKEVSKPLLGQVQAFFVSYNQQRGKTFTITGTGGPKMALKFLKSGSQAHKTATKK